MKKSKSEIFHASHFYHFAGNVLSCYGSHKKEIAKEARLLLKDSSVFLTLSRKEAAQILRDWKKASKA